MGSVIAADDFGNPLVDGGYSISGDLNSSGFTSEEIDTGGFFSGIIGIFTSMGRAIALVTFGITDALEGLAQWVVSIISGAITLFTIFWIIDSFWSG